LESGTILMRSMTSGEQSSVARANVVASILATLSQQGTA
jgi:hypothetical protein